MAANAAHQTKAAHQTSFRIDFMLPTERRSGSQVSQKFLVRLIVTLVPVVLVLAIVGLLLTVNNRKLQLKLKQQEFAEWNDKSKAVNELKVEKDKYQGIGNFIDGWRKTRVEWSDLLLSFQLQIPHNIQLQQFVANESVDQVQQTRSVRILINGIVRGENAEEYVIKLKDSLKQIPRFKELNSEVKVKRYAKYESGIEADRKIKEMDRKKEEDIRAFEIECVCPPRPIIGGETSPAK